MAGAAGAWWARGRLERRGGQVDTKGKGSLQASIGGNTQKCGCGWPLRFCASSRRSCPKRHLPLSSHGEWAPASLGLPFWRCCPVHSLHRAAAQDIIWAVAPSLQPCAHLTHRSLKFLILASSGIPGLGLHCSIALEGMEIATREDCRVLNCSLSHCPARSWVAEFLP